MPHNSKLPNFVIVNMMMTMMMMKELLLTIFYSSPRLGVLLEELPHPPGPKPEAFYEACLGPDHDNHHQDVRGQQDDDDEEEVFKTEICTIWIGKMDPNYQ